MKSPRALILALGAGLSTSISSACLGGVDDPVSLPLMRMTQPPPGCSFAPRLESILAYAVPSPSDVPGSALGAGGSAAVLDSGSFPDFDPQLVTYPVTVDAFA